MPAEKSPHSPSEASIPHRDTIGFTPDQLQEAREKQILGGQVILVVGAGPLGIGGAAAREAALQGATVVTSSREKADNSTALGLQEELRELGSNALWIPRDVSQPNAGKELVQETVAQRGRLDGIVLAPGLRRDTLFFGLKRPSLEEVMATNFYGPFEVIQAAFNHARRQDPQKLRVVGIGSVAAEYSPGQVAYAASKAAFRNMVRTVAAEIQGLKADKLPKLNVAINIIEPGLVNTPLVSDLKPEQTSALLQMTGADRPLDPSEVGQLAVYLISPYSKDRSGQVIQVIGKKDGPKATELPQ